jgi:hypothetical protein
MSIVYQYENSTIQYGDNYGNINHQGILSSNIAGSTILSTTFPTTSTGDSLGHYHYSEPTTNALQFLNVAGTGTGGHKFYSSNSTLAPVNTATIGLDGLTIDKSTAGSPILINLPNITTSGPNFVIFATPINIPPWNIGGIGNPVQVTSNTANMVTGVTYYLTGLSPQSGRITTNPDDTGIINTSDLSSLTQPILAWVNGTGPGVTQTINLNDTLQITTGTSTSKLSATDLLFNNVSLKTQVSTNTSNIATNTSNIATNTSNIATNTSNIATNTSNIATNTTNIAINTSNIATNTTNIARNTSSISKLQYASAINIANSPAVYGTLPSSPPMVPTSGAINSGFNGWYFKNISSVYNNISWGISFQPSNYIVSNLKGFYFTFVSLTTTSKPFVSVYTLPAQAPGGFYNSRRSYVPASGSATITAGIPYIYYFMYDHTYPTPFKYLHNAVALTLSPVSQVGAFASSELLYFAAISTNSISAVNTEELIIGETGVIIDDGTGTLIQPFTFNSGDVYSPNSYKTVLQGAGTVTLTSIDKGTTYIPTANFTISNAGLTGIPAGFFIRVHGNSVDRTITYNTSSTVIVHTASGSQNAQEVIFYWSGTQFAVYY